MATLEQELVAKISRLNADQQRKVLEFVQTLEAPPTRVFSARELMKLPQAQREHIIAEAFALAAEEDFEIFEAYSEEDFDEPS
jgi:hypothetical protein